MEDTPTAPAEAPQAPESVATPNTNPEPVAAPQMPDMHGFTSDQLADMKKFFDNNGGFDAIKSKISNPQPVQPAPEAQPEIPTSQPQQPVQQSLSGEEKYASISDQIRNGNVLKEMASFNIRALNQDGSINDQMVRRYLDLKAQTVPAKPTESEPNASAAPTVSYTEVGDNITDINQAYKVLMEPGNPNMAKAEEYIRNHFNPNAGKK